MRASSAQSQRLLFLQFPSTTNRFLHVDASSSSATCSVLTTAAAAAVAARFPLSLPAAGPSNSISSPHKWRLSSWSGSDDAHQVPLMDDESSDGDNSSDDHDVCLQITKLAPSSRRIHAKVAVRATLHTIWKILTDYERLPHFIPALLLSRLLEKRQNFARLLQIGQQDLAFGLKFNAKGVVDCYEKDLERLPSGLKRDIEFNMIEGDFQLFQGKWSIQQLSEYGENNDALKGEEFQTTLSYLVDVTPKPWLPVGLVEGRICREIKMNLMCIREEAEKVKQEAPHLERCNESDIGQSEK